MTRTARDLAEDIFRAALKAVDPYESVRNHLDGVLHFNQSGRYQKVLVIGFGKAACPMAKAMEDNLGDIIDGGIVITKYGHCISRKPEVKSRKSKIGIFEAGHPIPDENGQKGTEEIINLLREAEGKTLIVCLISGGGSALLVSPYEGISLSDKKKITELLLKAGADIFDLNAVRKHISKVKGGRLAELAYPAKMVSLILSDVIGDRLDVIASGPTAPDGTTFGDALGVLEKYNLTEKAPGNIIKILRHGVDGSIPETPKKGNIIFEKVENIIIGSNKIALNAARKKAEELGLHAEITSSELKGEARDAGKAIAKQVIALKDSKGINRSPKVLISGGETTVTVKGKGIGGRNMELALAFAKEIEGKEGITLLSAGTDGTDGPTDAAGAIVDGETVRKARAEGLDPGEYLNNNDSYSFFKEIEELFITGPTGTNVMDIQIAVIE